MFRHFSPGRTLLTAVCTAFALACSLGLQQVAPNIRATSPIRTDGRIIDRVTFEGLKTVDATYLQTVVRIASGSPWNREEIAAACARLAETGKFEGSPFAEAREEDGKLILVFVVTERPFVTEVTIIGNEKFSTDELLKEIEIAPGSPVNEFLMNQARQEIERKYHEAGYYRVTVDIDEEVLRNEQRILLRISEGPRVKIRKILFEGNTAFKKSKLESLIETKTYIWLFRTGAFDDETAQRDAAALKKFYVDRGYLEAQVGYRIELEPNQSDLTVIFQIEEGLLHIIKSIAFTGNTVFTEEQLAIIMDRSNVGKPIDADFLKGDLEKLKNEYGTIGYIYTEIVPTRTFDEEDGFVNLSIDIVEKQQYRFGRIDIKGNVRTKDKVVRRELRFFPEELYNTVAAKEAEQRLVETRLFSEATITPKPDPIGDLPGMRDALVDVKEADTTSILFGVGVTSNNGVVGSISIENRNFDLFDWPRTSSEFFKGKSFKGAGQIMRVVLEPGVELNRGRIEFREPYLLDQDLGLGVGAYFFDRPRDDYDEERIGGYISFDKRFRKGILDKWTGEIALRLEDVKISDVEFLSARELEEMKGSNFVTSVKPSLLRDTTDSAWLPGKGYRFKVSYEQAGALGGDYDYGKAIAEHEHYFTLYRDSFDRKHVVQIGASVGNIFGDAPVFDKFYAGGLGSIRGFEFRGISPVAGIREDKIGGDFLVLANAQYSFPLVGEMLRGVVFTDMGTVEESIGLDSWRMSVGFGARLYIKYFGPVPLAFDLAWPVMKEKHDDEQIFNFSFGTTF